MVATAELYLNLPTKRMAAGVLLFNEEREFLLVQPTYKDTWEIPGGVVERNESPKDAVVREVQEELSLDLSQEVISLTLLDYMGPGSEKTESLMFVFAGPILTSLQQSALSPFLEEIKSFRFVRPDDGVALLAPVLASRVLRALDAIKAQSFAYSEGSYGA
jgi:8-oxo-dGTP diphosphatase